MATAHSHDHYEETIYGIAGVLTWTVDGNPIDVGPGQALCIARGAIQPGRWRISVSSDALPDNHVLQCDSMELALVAGEQREISLRAVPQRRSVIFVGGETELRSEKLPRER